MKATIQFSMCYRQPTAWQQQGYSASLILSFLFCVFRDYIKWLSQCIGSVYSHHWGGWCRRMLSKRSSWATNVNPFQSKNKYNFCKWNKSQGRQETSPIRLSQSLGIENLHFRESHYHLAFVLCLSSRSRDYQGNSLDTGNSSCHPCISQF